ncbi:hypothetical protein AURDEDRAFT_168617 [Auricularia subglabra TFB-10046 SS5]|nr:hypothetical protein AURDEDRAFT_168617 [Auricularia subglabra TFB-10046 SS5]
MTPESRPRWVEIANDILKKDIVVENGTANLPMIARVHTMFQQWHPNSDSVFKGLQRILDAAKEVGTEVYAPVITKEARLALPLWLHLGRRDSAGRHGPRRTSQNDRQATRLTRFITGVWPSTVLQEVTSATATNATSHAPVDAAILLLPKWDPRPDDVPHPFALTEVENLRNKESWDQRAVRDTARHGPIHFDPSLPRETRPKGLVRVFTKQLRGTDRASTWAAHAAPPAYIYKERAATKLSAASPRTSSYQRRTSKASTE